MISTHARDYRVIQYPNGVTLGCAACHGVTTSPADLNGFGQAVFAVTGTENRPFWSRNFALLDSDGDQFTNGIEVGDPDGDGTAIPGYRVSSPGDPNSRPPVNQAPEFTSFPVVRAFIGLPYSYQSVASDAEDDALSFSKNQGPDWLSVDSAGAVTGIPPEGSAGKYFVGLRVTDDGLPNRTAAQLYELTVVSSYAGWKALRFTLPLEEDLADPLADPDGDGLANLGEYALRRNPKLADAPPVLLPTVSPTGTVTFAVAIRDDDPELSTRMEAAVNPVFADAVALVRTITDPAPGDGLLKLSFRDPTPVTDSGMARFWRLQFSLAP